MGLSALHKARHPPRQGSVGSNLQAVYIRNIRISSGSRQAGRWASSNGSGEASVSPAQTSHPAARLVPQGLLLASVSVPVVAAMCTTDASSLTSKLQELLKHIIVYTFHATQVLFIGYAGSWLVDSQQAALKQWGSGLNAARKSWCHAMQTAHLVCLASMVAWAISHHLASSPALDLAGVPREPLKAAWPLLFVGSVNILLMGWVELGMRLISKVKILQLDAAGPGKAHPVMVQGAQVCAAVYVWAGLLAMNIALAWLDVGRVVNCAAAVCLGLLGVGALTVQDPETARVMGRLKQA